MEIPSIGINATVTRKVPPLIGLKILRPSSHLLIRFSKNNSLKPQPKTKKIPHGRRMLKYSTLDVATQSYRRSSTTEASRMCTTWTSPQW